MTREMQLADVFPGLDHGDTTVHLYDHVGLVGDGKIVSMTCEAAEPLTLYSAIAPASATYIKQPGRWRFEVACTSVLNYAALTEPGRFALRGRCAQAVLPVVARERFAAGLEGHNVIAFEGCDAPVPVTRWVTIDGTYKPMTAGAGFAPEQKEAQVTTDFKGHAKMATYAADGTIVRDTRGGTVGRAKKYHAAPMMEVLDELTGKSELVEARAIATLSEEELTRYDLALRKARADAAEASARKAAEALGQLLDAGSGQIVPTELDEEVKQAIVEVGRFLSNRRSDRTAQIEKLFARGAQPAGRPDVEEEEQEEEDTP